MLFAVRFHDDPSRLEVRKAFMPTHLEWLRQHQDEVIAAGSLREDPQEAPIGGLWIVRASDRAAVESLLRSDPFWTEGLRERFEIHSWHRAFDEAVTL